MKGYIIGIDLGTGSAKAIAMTHAGEIIDTARVSYPTLQPQPGYQEQAPEIIWQAFVKCISRITSSRGYAPEGIGFSSAMHSILPVDDNGNALMNAIIWADNRSAGYARQLHQSPAGQTVYEKTGTPIHPMTPLCKLLWLRHNEPEIFNHAARFISVKEYVWHRLFHRYEVDYSIASATGLMDVHALRWNDESLRTADITPHRLSELVNTHHTRYCQDDECCSMLGVTKETAFVIGASDGCLANLGSFATQPGYMAITIGTSGAVRVTQKSPMLNFNAMTFNYRLDEATFVCGGPINNGGIALKWYAENLLGKSLENAGDYVALLDTLRETPPGANGLIFLPYILGERAPIWNSDACGMFFGLRAHHKQQDFTRAVVEGVSTALYDIAHNMIETGLDIQQLHVSGGFVHAEAWLQLIADLFGRKVCLVNTTDASATGAAYLAMKALQMIAGYEQLAPKKFKEFTPDISGMAAYRELFTRYRALYAQVAPLMKPAQDIG